MKKVILTRWLPASGKTTRAKQLVYKNPWQYKRINKDDLRNMLDWWKRSKANEKFVIATRNYLILSALTDGKSVIVDDTNIHPKHFDHIKELVKGMWVQVEYKEFDTDMEECIERDLKRPNSVWRKVIERMYKERKGWEENHIEQDGSLPPAVIFDIDWTLAHMNWRSPYDWSRVWEDEPDVDIVNLLSMYRNRGFKILIVSWRDWICEPETRTRLLETIWDRGWELYMREAWDDRKDYIIKKEILDELIKEYYIKLVVDDRSQTVQMWRRSWLKCLQVADWDF